MRGAAVKEVRITLASFCDGHASPPTGFAKVRIVCAAATKAIYFKHTMLFELFFHRFNGIRS